jgi:hypothetical protein
MHYVGLHGTERDCVRCGAPELCFDRFLSTDLERINFDLLVYHSDGDLHLLQGAELSLADK